MELPEVEVRRYLQPLSWLYGVGVNFRNWLYDREILKQKKFKIPVICVGNITVGGTGKTPHIEYLIRLLSPKYKVAVLSRGYKRKSRGFQIVEIDSKVSDTGDEPLQIKKKFPSVLVVVDKNRVNAIERIIKFDKDRRPDVILLDDGFQHRSVQPSLSILLVDSNRPAFEDKLLPSGLLREPLRGKDRASIVLVTKCHHDLQPIDFRIYSNGLDLFPFQSLFFTSLDYEEIKPVFPELNSESLYLNNLLKKHIFLITGIASPEPLVRKLEHKTYNLYTKFFPDHHNFTKRDIEAVKEMVEKINEENKIIITTEKDAIRFRSLNYLSEEIKRIIYYIPVKITFLNNQEKFSFNKKIVEHVRNNKANS
jgi:tetraacyldisaccharide 4'-kinase